MKKIRVFTAFSGYDSQCLALDRLAAEHPDFGYELVGWSEIDRYAIAAHNAIYPQWADRNYGDIAQIDWLQVPNYDLFTYSFPCQAVSCAGKMGGLEEGSGTTSSLLWECRRAIECKRPRICLMENVKNLVSKKFMPEFRKWIETMESFGYKNFWKVLNAKHFGVPQNRERVFMISILDRGGSYAFPEGFPLTLRLKDILEKNVPESYYLKQKQIDHIIAHCERKVAEGCGFKTNFQDENGISGAIKTKEGSREYYTYIKEEIISRQDAITPPPPPPPSFGTDRIIEVGNILPPRKNFPDPPRGRVISPEGIASTICASDYSGPKLIIVIEEDEALNVKVATLKGYETVYPGGVFDIQYPNSTKRRSRVKDGGNVASTLTCGGTPPCYYEAKIGKRYRIRKLTERECFRLMGVDDSVIDIIQSATTSKGKQAISKTQQYKMAGNSIVVDCLYYIFETLYINTPQLQENEIIIYEQ